MLPIISLTGNLTQDPELSFTKTGTPVARIRVACSQNKRAADGSWERDETNTLYINVTAWKRKAENATETLRKGDAVIVQGRLKDASYVKQDGTRVNGYEVEADEIGAALHSATANITRNTTTRVQQTAPPETNPWDEPAPF